VEYSKGLSYEAMTLEFPSKMLRQHSHLDKYLKLPENQAGVDTLEIDKKQHLDAPRFCWETHVYSKACSNPWSLPPRTCAPVKRRRSGQKELQGGQRSSLPCLPRETSPHTYYALTLGLPRHQRRVPHSPGNLRILGSGTGGEEAAHSVLSASPVP
jgi:hypothetical protein